jgi:hypothetical protein
MVDWKRLVAVKFWAVVFSAGWGLAGCSSRAVSANGNSRSVAAAKARPVQRAAKGAPRESALVTYSDPEHGISFRYPRTYLLEEGEPQEDLVNVKTQEELEREQPGAVLVATVVVPEDSYPNTTFVEGTLQFAVNPRATPESCRDFALSRAGDTGTLTIQGVVFAWEEEASTVDDTEVVERTYAGYTDGACHEFFARVTVGETGSDGGAEKPADAEKIVRHLEKIVTSLQWEGNRSAEEKAAE